MTSRSRQAAYLMWRYRITDLLRRAYWRLEMPAALGAESRSRRDWNHFLDRHYRRKWNVRVSKVMDNATHVAMYFGSYLKKPPVSMSRLEHYAGRDELSCATAATGRSRRKR